MSIKKIKTPYFQNDPIPLRFEARSKSGDLDVMSAKVSVFSGNKNIFKDAPCEIEDDVVSFTVPPGSTQQMVGDCRADFTVYIMPDIVRTHIIRFHVTRRIPVFGDGRDVELMPLTEDSDEYKVSGVMAKAARHLRRAGMEIVQVSQDVRDIAERLTGRRI